MVARWQELGVLDSLPDEGRTETELRIVDLATHKISYLPRPPKRAWSPRWSPDGRYLACLTNPYPATDGLEVYDFKTNNWKILLTESGSGNWASWSRDSRSIYSQAHWMRIAKSSIAFRWREGDQSIADLPGLRPTGPDLRLGRIRSRRESDYAARRGYEGDLRPDAGAEVNTLGGQALNVEG